MKKHLLMVLLTASGFMGMFSSPAIAGYYWVPGAHGHWHLGEPCSFLQGVWCAASDGCVASSNCGFTEMASPPPKGDTSKLHKIDLPNGKKVYLSPGNLPIGPSNTELAIKANGLSEVKKPAGTDNAHRLSAPPRPCGPEEKPPCGEFEGRFPGQLK